MKPKNNVKTSVRSCRCFVDNFFMELFVKKGTRKTDKKKLIIYLPGLPSLPGHYSFLMKLAEFGYPSILLRYEGTWESKGHFIEDSFVGNLMRLLKKLKEGNFKDSFSGKRIKFEVDEIILIGSSFGTLVALELCRRISFVKKIVLLSPIFSLKDLDKYSAEPSSQHLRTLKLLSSVYRFDIKDFKKLVSDKIIPNQLNYIPNFKNKKVLIFEGKKDKVTPLRFLKKFEKELKRNNIDYTLHIINYAGHGLTGIVSKHYMRTLLRFFKQE